MRVATLALLASTVVVVSSGAGVAHAASYQYWSYWSVQDGAWRFAPVGPVSTRPADGAVEGWRFAVTGVEGQVPPSLDPATAFSTICGDAASVPEGSKRVAIVLDAGTTQDAPEGETPPAPVTQCVVIDANATGYDVVSASNKLRTNDGLICAINGYPRSACGDQVADRPSHSASRADSATPSQSASRADSASPSQSASRAPSASPSQSASLSETAAEQEPRNNVPWLPAAIVALVVVAIAVVVVRARRR